ncbi:MAG TPA: MFS transporter, partial [Candidatus Acidoferrales bacterium]|nr:MFS transporter [Candidatus Acidoferrales bacterium]
AMDTVGAVAGPLTALLLVSLANIRTALAWTIVPGLLASISFLWLVPSGKSAIKHQAFGFLHSLRQLPVSFRRFLMGVFANGLGDFAPTLLILRASQILTPEYGAARAATLAVGLYTLHNIVFAVISYPAGVLADRIGKRGLLAVAYALAAVMCIGFIFAPPTIPWLAVLFTIAGIHIGIQQGLEKSAAAELLASEIRGTGFGVLATVNGIGDFASSIVVGTLWTMVAPAAGFLYGAIFSLAGAALIYFWR